MPGSGRLRGWMFALLPLAFAAAPAGAQTQPTRTIQISEGLDSASAAAALRRLPESRAPTSEWVLTVHYGAASGTVDSVVVNPGVHRNPSTLPPEALEEVKSVLRAAARALAPSDSAARLDIVARPGRRPVLREPTETPPKVRNGAAMNAALTRVADAFARGRPKPPQRYSIVVVLAMRVGSDGVPSGVEVYRHSLHPQLNEDAVLQSVNLRFAPATIEGVPVAVLIHIPVTYSIQ